MNLDYKALISSLHGKRLYILLVSSAASLAALIFLVESGFFHPLSVSLGSHLRWLLKESYAAGQIFDIPTPYDYKYEARMESNYFNNFVISFFINNWRHILVLYARRAVSFLGVWVWKLQHAGMLTRLKYLIPFSTAGFLGYMGIASIIKNRIFKENSILIFSILSIQFFCIFFFMDSAFRYRVPSLVFLAIIAAYGLDRAVIFGERLYNKVKGTV